MRSVLAKRWFLTPSGKRPARAIGEADQAVAPALLRRLMPLHSFIGLPSGRIGIDAKSARPADTPHSRTTPHAPNKSGCTSS